MDKVTRPDHYKDKNGKECIDYIRETSHYEGFLWGNVYKYIYRCTSKNGKEDVEKARVYLEWLANYKGYDTGYDEYMAPSVLQVLQILSFDKKELKESIEDVRAVILDELMDLHTSEDYEMVYNDIIILILMYTLLDYEKLKDLWNLMNLTEK